MRLTNYKELNDVGQKCVKVLANLLYKHNRKWSRDTIQLERLENCVYVNAYLRQFENVTTPE